MRPARSIALRLALWLTLVTGLFWLGAATVSALVLHHELQEAFDESLSQSAYRLLPLALHDLREPGERHEPIPRMDGSDGNAFTYFVHDATGRVLIRAEDAPEDIEAVPTGQGYMEFEGRRAYAITDDRTGLGIVVMETSEHRQEALADATGALFWPLVALVPLLAIGIWMAVRLGMRPLNRFSRDIALRNSANLAPIDAEGQPAELAPIAREVTALLDRLRAAMESERNFAANSAHELRTPIAGALAQTQRLALDLGDHPASARVQEIEHALRHLSLLSEKLLQLARLDAGFARSDSAIDVMPVIALVLRDFQYAPTTADRIKFRGDQTAKLTTRINADAFAMVLRNVLQNALIHGEPGGLVLLNTDHWPTITVRNNGRVVPPDTMTQLGSRFARGDTNAGGTGLGLAIVQTIMDQTGGTMEMASPIAGEADGFEVKLQFLV